VRQTQVWGEGEITAQQKLGEEVWSGSSGQHKFGGGWSDGRVRPTWVGRERGRETDQSEHKNESDQSESLKAERGRYLDENTRREEDDAGGMGGGEVKKIEQQEFGWEVYIWKKYDSKEFTVNN